MNQFRNWWISPMDKQGFTHMVPIDDDSEHRYGDECECNPKRDQDTPHMLVHNSYDGREAYETGYKKVS